jgi:gluconate:H+ symporter, GntP family
VNMGLAMVGGIVVGLVTAAFGVGFAYWANRRWPIPLRETADVSMAELEALAKRDERTLPPLWLALAPILLPVFLIGGDAFAAAYFEGLEREFLAVWVNVFLDTGTTLGDKNLALIISGVIALATLAWQKRDNLKSIPSAIEGALLSGGLIILITAAGGAFGGVLQQTGIAERIAGLAAEYRIGVLPLAFFVTMLIRVAQGSATVAMITTVGIVGGMATPEQLGFHPLYVALAIGCGSKPLPWMNDSGFWVICKMSGLTEKEMLKTFSLMITLMGLLGLVVTMALARLLPLV